mgnify:CR=1 FL=1
MTSLIVIWIEDRTDLQEKKSILSLSSLNDICRNKQAFNNFVNWIIQIATSQQEGVISIQSVYSPVFFIDSQKHQFEMLYI